MAGSSNNYPRNRVLFCFLIIFINLSIIQTDDLVDPGSPAPKPLKKFDGAMKIAFGGVIR